MGNVRNILKDLEELDSGNQVSVNLNLQLEKLKKKNALIYYSVFKGIY